MNDRVNRYGIDHVNMIDELVQKVVEIIENDEHLGPDWRIFSDNGQDDIKSQLFEAIAEWKDSA